MSSVNSWLALAGMILGFVLPSWLFHTLILKENYSISTYRDTRSSEDIPSKPVFHITVNDINYLSEKYFTELDRVSSSTNDKSEHFIFLEIMNRRIGTSGVSWNEDIKHKRHTWIQSHDSAENKTLNVIQRFCDRKSHDRYSWTVLVDSMTYVNINMLRHFLQRLPISVPILFGQAIGNNTGICSMDKGVILNRAVMKRVCDSLHSKSDFCSGNFNSSGFSTYQMLASGVSCTDVSPKFPEFFWNLKNEDIVGMKNTQNFGSMTAFVGYNLTSHQMIHIHKNILNTRAIHISQSLDLLDKTRVDNISSQRLKRESENEVVTSNIGGIPLPNFLQNDPLLPDCFHHLIDKDGNLFKETCTTSSINIKSRVNFSPSYMKTLASLNSSVPNVNNVQKFGFKLHKPNIGHEYHLYFVHDSPDNDLAQAHQVITIEEYNRPRIVDKSTAQLQPLVILVTLPTDHSEARYFLDNVRKAAMDLISLGQKCTIFVHHCPNQDASYISDIIKEYRDVTMRIIPSDVSGLSNGTIADELSDVPKGYVLVRIPHNVYIQSDFLLRCSLIVGKGSVAYFPIPFIRTDIERLRELKHMNSRGLHEITNDGIWDKSKSQTYCAALSDVIGVMNNGYDIMKDMYSVLRRTQVDVIRKIDKDVHVITSSLLRYECSLQHS